MPQNTTRLIPKWTWTQLTDVDVTAITFINAGGTTMMVKATVGATAPTDLLGSIPYGPGQGETSAVTLAQLFPGVTGANRLWAWGRDDATSCAVSNA